MEIKIHGHRLLTDYLEDELKKCNEDPNYFWNEYMIFSKMAKKRESTFVEYKDASKFNEIYFSAVDRRKKEIDEKVN